MSSKESISFHDPKIDPSRSVVNHKTSSKMTGSTGKEASSNIKMKNDYAILKDWFKVVDLNDPTKNMTPLRVNIILAVI